MKKKPDVSSRHEEAITEVRQIVAEAKELSRAADGAFTDNLAAWIAARYAITARRLAMDNENGLMEWDRLRLLCSDLVDLRRGDHRAEALRIERERLEMERIQQKENLEKQFRVWAEENREKICQDSALTPEEKQSRIRQILGLEPISSEEHDDGQNLVDGYSI